jgi:hypothetical protein
LGDLNADLIRDHLERDRGNGVRSRKARLAVIRSFLKYTAHQDHAALAAKVIRTVRPAKASTSQVIWALDRNKAEAGKIAHSSLDWFGSSFLDIGKCQIAGHAIGTHAVVFDRLMGDGDRLRLQQGQCRNVIDDNALEFSELIITLLFIVLDCRSAAGSDEP